MNIYEYTDYRHFIADYYQSQKKVNPTYSYTVLARMSGLPSRGYVKLVIDGKRNLSLKTIPKLAQGLRLSSAERRYFELLVRLNQSKSSQDKSDLYAQMIQHTGRRKSKLLGGEAYRYYSKWYYCAIRELVLLSDCPKEPAQQAEWMSKRLGKQVTPAEAAGAVDELLGLGLLVRAEDGSLTQKDECVSLPDEVVNFAVRDFHRQVIRKSLDYVDDPLESREISGVTLAIEARQIQEARKFLKEMRQQFNQKFSARAGAKAVYQLNIQFFDLTEATEDQTISPPDPVNGLRRAGQEVVRGEVLKRIAVEKPISEMDHPADASSTQTINETPINEGDFI